MVDLTPEQIRELVERFGSMHEAAIAALQTSLYADEFWATGVRFVRKRDAPPDATGADAFGVMYPQGDRETLFWKLVWLTHMREQASAPLPARPPLPNETQLNSFTYGSLQKAVKSFARGATGGDVQRGARLPPQDARRVRLMIEADLLRLTAAGKLVVDPRVAQKGPRYVLRYVDETGSRWLDPDKTLRNRKG